MAKKIVDVAIIIPDASPVLTLARIGRLYLLKAFGAPIHLVDQVHFEVTKPTHDTKGEIKTFFQRLGEQLHIVETITGEGFKARQLRDPSYSGRNLGEQAVNEYARHLIRTTGPSFVPLVLFEDPDVLDSQIADMKRAHLMNTTAWLYGMYEIGFLPDAPEIIDAINSTRKTMMRPFEKEERTKKIVSQWKRKVVR